MSEPQSQGENQSPPSKPKSPAWIAGAVLILVGIVFIVRNVTGFELHNWWALFILIPGLGSLYTAYTMYRRNGDRFTAASRGPLIGGVVVLTLAAIFLLDLDFGAIWPVFLIIAGIAVLLGGFGRR